MSAQMHNNPNFMDQLNEWQQKRSEKGEDPTDWNAFRDHLMAIGAPDPGFLRPDEFSAYADRTGANTMGDAAGEGATGARQGAETPPQGEPGT